jgi:hypothetical protein
MALPTASLGQMPSLNVPTHIPNQVVNKQPKLWQQALAGILAQAAGQAVSQGVGNSMARDYAGEYGEQEATGFDSFLKGPKVGEKEHARRQSQKFAEKNMATDAGVKLGLHEYDAVVRQGEQDARRFDRDMSSIDRNIEGMQQTKNASRISRREMGEKAALQDQGQDAAVALAELRATLEAANNPQNKALADKYSEDARGAKLMNDMLDRRMNPKPAEGAAAEGIDPSIAKFRQTSPQQQRVAERLKDTSKYPTAEMLGVGKVNFADLVPKDPIMGNHGGVYSPPQQPRQSGPAAQPQQAQAPQEATSSGIQQQYAPGGPGGGIHVPSGKPGTASMSGGSGALDSIIARLASGASATDELPPGPLPGPYVAEPKPNQLSNRSSVVNSLVEQPIDQEYNRIGSLYADKVADPAMVAKLQEEALFNILNSGRYNTPQEQAVALKRIQQLLSQE